MSIERKQFLVWLMIMVVFGGDVPRRMTARDVRAHFAARSHLEIGNPAMSAKAQAARTTLAVKHAGAMAGFMFAVTDEFSDPIYDPIEHN